MGLASRISAGGRRKGKVESFEWSVTRYPKAARRSNFLIFSSVKLRQFERTKYKSTQKFTPLQFCGPEFQAKNMATATGGMESFASAWQKLHPDHGDLVIQLPRWLKGHGLPWFETCPQRMLLAGSAQAFAISPNQRTSASTGTDRCTAR